MHYRHRVVCTPRDFIALKHLQCLTNQWCLRTGMFVAKSQRMPQFMSQNANTIKLQSRAEVLVRVSNQHIPLLLRVVWEKCGGNH